MGGAQLLLTCIPSTLCARRPLAGEGGSSLRRTGERLRESHHEDSDVARQGGPLYHGLMLIREIVRAIGHRRGQEAHDLAGRRRGSAARRMCFL